MNKRQTRLLEILNERVTWVTSDELAEIIGCSNKTVQNDVKKLKKMLPGRWDIITERGKGIMLKGPANESLNVELTFYSEDDLNAHESAKLKILMALTSDQQLTLDSLSEKLYYNHHTIRKLLQEIENDLNKVQLKLERNPLRIEGPELAIRFFIYRQRKDFYGEAFLFNKHYHIYNKYTGFLRLVNNKERLTVGALPLVKLFLFINVNLERIKNGYSLRDGINPEPILKLDFYKHLLPYIKKIEEHENIKLPDNERVNIFFAFIYTEFHFTYNENEKELILKKFINNPSTFPTAYEFILFLQTELQYNLIADDDFVLSIYDLYKKIELRNLNVQFKYAGSRNSSLYINNQYPKTFILVKNICSKWTMQNKLPSFTLDTISTIVILIEQFKIENNLDKKRVAVIYSETIDLNNLTSAILKREFMNFITLKNIPLNQIDLLDTDSYDLIITDSQLSSDNKKVILINKVPNERDLTIIRDALDI